MILIFYSILFFVFYIYIDSTHRVFQEILKYFSCFDFINEYIIHPEKRSEEIYNEISQAKLYRLKNPRKIVY